jgi:hypothetical protein
VSYALAILSHPTVALCFTPIAVAYVFFFSGSKQRVRAVAVLIVALLLGVGLTAAYLLPAMLDQDKAYVLMQTAGLADYHNNWLWRDGDEITRMGRYVYNTVTGKGIDVTWEIPFKARTLAVTLVTLAAIVAFLLVIRRFEAEARLRRIALFYASIALVYLFLMTKPSAFIWEMVPFLRFTQFPFRLNVMLVVCVAALTALAGPYLLQPRARMITLLLGLIVLGWIAAEAYVSTQVYSAWRVVPERAELHRQWMRTKMDFLTMWPKPSNVGALQDFSNFDRFVATHPPKTARLEAFSTGQIVGTAQVESWRPRRVVLKIEAPRDSELTLNHFYYAGWQSRIEGTATSLTVNPSSDGLIQVDVPKGEYNLILELPKDKAERAGRVISLVSLALLVMTMAWAGFGGKPADISAAR